MGVAQAQRCLIAVTISFTLAAPISIGLSWEAAVFGSSPTYVQGHRCAVTHVHTLEGSSLGHFRQA